MINSSVKEQIKIVIDSPSCYPNEKRKSKEVREHELYDWYERYQEVNSCYNLYGMDCQSCDHINNWLDRGLFRKQRHNINGTYYLSGSKFPYDYTLLMRDKEIFEMLMKSVFGTEIKYLQSKYVFKNSTVFKNSEHGKERVCFDELIEEFEGKKIVFKNSFGFGGSGIKICEISNNKIVFQSNEYDMSEFLSAIDDTRSTWLIQEYIDQHPVLNSFNCSSVNTMRILTYNTGDRVEFGNSVLRFGREGSCVDSCGRGGYFCGINDIGTVSDDMFSFTEKMRYRCPYGGITIPDFKDAVSLVLEAHSHIPQLFSVGWDVVITNNGPMIFEGNDGWDPYLSQAPLGYEQRTLWNKLLSERIKVYGNN